MPRRPVGGAREAPGRALESILKQPSDLGSTRPVRRSRWPSTRLGRGSRARAVLDLAATEVCDDALTCVIQGLLQALNMAAKVALVEAQ